MRLVRLLIFLPIAVTLGLFLTSNTQNVHWSFWPLPYSIGTPAYAVPLLALGLGVIIGALIVWLKARFR